MTLGGLLGATYVEGRIVVSVWNDEEELDRETYESNDGAGLYAGCMSENGVDVARFENCEIKYIFANDGVGLVLECYPPEER